MAARALVALVGALLAALPPQVAPEKPIRPLPARPVDDAARGDAANAPDAFESPEAAVFAGKVALGEGLEAGSDPKRRLDGFLRARRAFEAALAFGARAPQAARVEAETFLAEIVKELPSGGSAASKATANLEVLALGLEIERRTFEFDSKKYEDLLRRLDKAGKAGDPIEIQKAREACTKDAVVRTEWTSKDESRARKALADARREVLGLSKGRIDFDWSVSRHPVRVPDAGEQRFGSRHWALNPLHPFEDEFGRALAEAILERDPRPDFVLLLPKMERRGERLPGPAFEDELRYPLPALGGGLVGVLHLSVGENDDRSARGADGSAALRPPTLEEKLVAAIYALLRDRIPGAIAGEVGSGQFGSSAGGAADSVLAEIPGSGADGLVDRRRRDDVSAERKRFLETAYAERVTDAMLDALVTRNRTFARRIVPATVDPAMGALFDADLATCVRLRPGVPLEIALARPVEIRGIAFAGATVPGESARRIAVTVDDGAALFAMQAFSGERPLERYALDAPLRVASIRLFSPDGPEREIAEIVLTAR